MLLLYTVVGSDGEGRKISPLSAEFVPPELNQVSMCSIVSLYSGHLHLTDST